MVQLLNDEEIVEGLIGGLGSVIGVIYYKNSFFKSENVILISIIGWMIIWFTRKLLMRLYRKLKKNNQQHFDKKNYGINVKNYLNLNDFWYHALIIVMLVLLVYLILINNSKIDDKFATLDKDSLYHILFIIILLLLTFFK